MDLSADFTAPCAPERMFAEVSDLVHYPQWLTIVTRAVPDPEDPAVWSIDLRGRLGPLARSKRLRMVCTERVEGSSLRFERREIDGRSHSRWVLAAEVEAGPSDGETTLRMHLHYSGSLAGSLLERMLRDEIERSRPRLLARLV